MNPNEEEERELLATIAKKDKKILQLEETIEAQAAFIESILKISDQYRSLTSTQRKPRRSVSWAADVDDAKPCMGNSSHSHSSEREIYVDDLEEVDVDELSVLSEDDEKEAKTESSNPLPDQKQKQQTSEGKKKPSAAESRMIQSIIERIRDDSDSVSV